MPDRRTADEVGVGKLGAALFVVILTSACGGPGGETDTTIGSATSLTTASTAADTTSPSTTTAATVTTVATTVPDTVAPSTAPPTSAAATTAPPGSVSSGSLFDALSNTPFPSDDVPYSSLPLEFETEPTQTDFGEVVIFRAVPSAGTSLVITYGLGVGEGSLDVILSSMPGVVDQEFSASSLEGFDDAQCTTFTEPTGLPAAMCGAQFGGDVILANSTLVLFEGGQTNESLAEAVLALAADHYLTVREGIAGE